MRDILKISKKIKAKDQIKYFFFIFSDINCGDILKLIQSNLERNKSIINAEISVYGLDFFDRNWPNDLEDKIKNVGIILAADGNSFKKKKYFSQKMLPMI